MDKVSWISLLLDLYKSIGLRGALHDVIVCYMKLYKHGADFNNLWHPNNFTKDGVSKNCNNNVIQPVSLAAVWVWVMVSLTFYTAPYIKPHSI